jgi:hypothetical protein
MRVAMNGARCSSVRFTARAHTRPDSRAVPGREQENPMTRTSLLLALSLAGLGAGSAAAQYYPTNSGYPDAQARTVRCESNDSRQATCRIESGSQVRLVNQLSRQDCVLGSNWNYDDTRIIVTDGCRAEFMVSRDPRAYGYGSGVSGVDARGYNDGRGVSGVDNGYDNRGYDNRGYDDRYGDNRSGEYRNGTPWGQTIHCASHTRNGQRTQCGDAIGHYSLVGHSANCVEGRTWGDAQRGVWVSGKCSANFRMTSYTGRDGDWRDNYPRQDSFAQSVRCESNGNWRTYCGDARAGTYALRDTRNGYCVENSTWGNDTRGLWVSGNCRADFDRTYSDNDMHPYVQGVSQRY